MSKFWSRGLDGLAPYTPGERPRQSGLVKLNTNESPFGPSPAVADVLRTWPVEQLRRYPDPDSTALRDALAREHGVRIDNVFVGNGSDEVLAHTFCALLGHDRPILMPDVTYAFYRTYCALYGIAYKAIPLDSKYRIDVRAYEEPCGGVVLANPNAPTGIALARADIERMLASHPDQVVVVDEAYVDFGGESAIELIDRYPNLLVVRTFSKSRGLAGIRVGYALGDTPLIDGLNGVKNSFNSYPLSSLSVAAAIASLGDADYFAKTVAEIVRLRQLVAEELGRLGMIVLPSSANFLFAAHPACPASRLMAGLRQNGVLVRHFVSPRIENFLRITIGSESDCSALVMALTRVLSGQSG
ncbi:histidinol-phosphate transaminase [Cupriavidus oxalaticus]|uniref:histidinol-phosphate transaminase n=1 Tax=Cupriavidus oxalaticus TaxID=96344 RepID=UPI0040338BB7